VDRAHRFAWGFGRVAAAAYDAGRAPYEPETVAALGLPARGRVLDLAAGTGLLSAALLAAGHDVTAVEPMPEMRAQLEARLGPERVLEGTAERIPVADRSVTAVTVGDAFHWFDPDAAAAEVHRVLVDGGTLALVWRWTYWGHDGPAPEWAVAIRRRLAELREDHPGFTEDQGRGGIDRHGGFGEWRHEAVRFERRLDRAGLAAQLDSISYISMMPAAERQALVEELVALSPPEGYDEPNVADAWVTKKRTARGDRA
jgi:SAM-dependent methyltransferase